MHFMAIRIMNKFKYLFFLLLVATSCFDRLDVEVNDCYSLIAVDGRENMNLVHDYGEYALNIVPATVFSVEVYEDYLVVKQHPQYGLDGISREYTNYYILKAKDTDYYSAKKSRIGPIKLENLDEEMSRLNLKSSEKIKDITFEDLM